MPTPTFIKNMRNQVRNNGGKAVMTVVGENKPTRVKILEVPYDTETGRYYAVVQDFSNISKQGAPVFEVWTDDIQRPVRYNG